MDKNMHSVKLVGCFSTEVRRLPPKFFLHQTIKHKSPKMIRVNNSLVYLCAYTYASCEKFAIIE